MRPAGFVPTWLDLVDIKAGDRVLLVDSGRSSVAAELAHRGAHVTDLDSRSKPEHGVGRYDLVCLDAVKLTAPLLTYAATQLSPEARLVIVVDNGISPLRAWDVMTNRPGGVAIRWSVAGLHRRLGSVGLHVEQHFALLRSSVQPVTALDVMTTSAVRAVVQGSRGHVEGLRGVLLGSLPRWSPAAVAGLAPAWLVVAGRPGRQPDPLRVVGKIANKDSAEVKVVRGDPPAVLEKRYHGAPPVAEVSALRALEDAEFALSPRLLSTPDEHTTLTTWLPGRPLRIGDLSDDALVTWVRRAAQVLARFQQLTERPDGTVLVHGDLWLGNFLVEGDDVSGVVDWTEAHRGSPETDRGFLLDSLLAALTRDDRLTERLAARLAAARDAGCAARPVT